MNCWACPGPTQKAQKLLLRTGVNSCEVAEEMGPLHEQKGHQNCVLEIETLPWSIMREDKALNFSLKVCMASDHCLDMTDSDARITSPKSSMLEAC